MFWGCFSAKGVGALVRVNGIMKERRLSGYIGGKPEAECEESWNGTSLDLSTGQRSKAHIKIGVQMAGR